jgi:hypothetical protein
MPIRRLGKILPNKEQELKEKFPCTISSAKEST